MTLIITQDSVGLSLNCTQSTRHVRPMRPQSVDCVFVVRTGILSSLHLIPALSHTRNKVDIIFYSLFPRALVARTLLSWRHWLNHVTATSTVERRR